MKNYSQGLSRLEFAFYLNEKKKNQISSPDISKMQMVEMDDKTKIYIAHDASADEARSRYTEYVRGKKKF
jgi:hypothetical protein